MGREEEQRTNIKSAIKSGAAALLRWTACACVIGVVLGVVGTCFSYSIAWATAARTANEWLLWLLPVGGAAIALLYRAFGIERDRGTNLVIASARSDGDIPVQIAPLIFAATDLTHLLGGSSGREGAALQMGGSVAAQLGKLLRLDDRDRRVAVLCGASAAFAALFGTPVTAGLFSAEVIASGSMGWVAVVPCLVSAFVGFGVSRLLGVEDEKLSVADVPGFGMAAMGQAVVVAVCCALLSIVFCQLLHGSGTLFRKLLPNSILRAAVGGLLVVGLTVLFRSGEYNGAGMDVVEAALAGQAKPEAFALKMLLTAVTLGAGFKGGEIVPAFFIGATFGCTLGGALGMSPSFGAAIGLIALFCGSANCPIASFALSIELFDTPGLALYAAIGVVVSYFLSGRHGLYQEQTLRYPKLWTLLR